MTNKRRIGLITLALLVIVLGAFGVDQLSKQSPASAEPVALEGDISDGGVELDYGDEMALDDEFAADMSGDETALDENYDSDADISAEELALWEECKAQLDQASTEEIAEDSPCAALEAEYGAEFGYSDDFGEGDDAMTDETFLEDFDGEIMEAGFMDDFGFDQGFGMDEGYGLESGDDFDQGYGSDEYGLDEGYGEEYAESGLEDAGWIALSVLGFLFEAALIGAVAAGIIIWMQRRQSATKAKK